MQEAGEAGGTTMEKQQENGSGPGSVGCSGAQRMDLWTTPAPTVEYETVVDFRSDSPNRGSLDPVRVNGEIVRPRKAPPKTQPREAAPPGDQERTT